MNPFDLRGPAFLGFYLVASACGLFLLYLVSRGLFSSLPSLPSGEARRQLRDPYLLAYLRGGAREMLQIVAFSLNRRKLLTSTGAKLVATKRNEALQAVRNSIELALLSQCSSSQPGAQLLQNNRLQIAADNYAEPLRNSGLIADEAELSRRMPAFLAIAGTLLALAATKIYLAFQRGHTNVIFLILLAAVALFAAFTIFQRRKTNAGARALADQQTLFMRLKGRVKRLAADNATDEAVLVAAAFGLDALPKSAYPFAARLKRQAQSGSSSTTNCSSTYTSSCASSCGSSGGSSCGSSCGGGGGCGGCGS